MVSIRVIKIKKLSPEMLEVTAEHLVVIRDGFRHYPPLLNKEQLEIARNLPVGAAVDFNADGAGPAADASPGFHHYLPLLDKEQLEIAWNLPVGATVEFNAAGAGPAADAGLEAADSGMDAAVGLRV